MDKYSVQIALCYECLAWSDRLRLHLYLGSAGSRRIRKITKSLFNLKTKNRTLDNILAGLFHERDVVTENTTDGAPEGSLNNSLDAQRSIIAAWDLDKVKKLFDGLNSKQVGLCLNLLSSEQLNLLHIQNPELASIPCNSPKHTSTIAKSMIDLGERMS